MNKNLKITLTVLGGICIFALITLIYFRQGLKDDYVLQQSDIRQFKGSAKEIQDYRAANPGKEALWTNSMFGGMPAYQISVLYANKALGILNSVFQLFLPQPFGMVFLYFIGFFILLLCCKIDPWISVVGAIAFGLSSYLLVIIAAGHNTQAVATAYAPPLLGGIILIFRGKWLLGFLTTALFMGLELYSNHPQITYYFFLLIGIIVFVELIGYIKEKQLMNFAKAVVIMLAGLTIGVLPNVGNLWTTAEYGKYTTRGPSELTIQADGKKNTESAALKLDYITDYSYGVDGSFSLLVSNFKGGPTSEAIGSRPELMKDVDEQYRETVADRGFYFAETTPVYAGCLIVLLSIAGMFIIKSRMKWALLVASLFALMLSWGKNFQGLTDFFFHYFPFYNKFRGPSMLLIVVSAILPLLSALTLQELTSPEKAEDKNPEPAKKGKFTRAQLGVMISTGAIVLFLLLNLVAPSMFNTFHSPDESPEATEVYARQSIRNSIINSNPTIDEQTLNNTVNGEVRKYMAQYPKVLEQIEIPRIAYVKRDIWRTLLFVLLGGGLLLIFVFSKLPKTALIAGLGSLILIDLWVVNWRHVNKNNFTHRQAEAQISYQASYDRILADKSAIDFRVVHTARYANIFNNGEFSYYHKSIGGYHGAKLKKFQELREFYLDRELQIAAQIADLPYPDSLKTDYLNKSTPILNMMNVRYILTEKNADSLAYLNKAANGNAWFVSKIKWAPTADSEIVWTGQINNKNTAVINEKFKKDLPGSDRIAATFATIKLDEYQPNHLTYSFDSKSQQLIVFSEVWYPAGWNAYVDGKLTPHVCANYLLRAMMVPEGKHKIEFKFEPTSYFTGEKISFVGVILFYLTVLGGFAFAIYKLAKGNSEKKS